MPIEITMPRLSDTMEQGTVVSWNVKEGDTVSAGDVLGDIETDKATMELQNFDDGVVAGIFVAEGDTVEVGRVIAVLAEEGEDADAIKAGAQGGAASGASGGAKAAAGGESTSESATAVAEPASTNGASTSNGASSSDDGGRIFASPLARKIAEEKGIDLAGVQGTGPSGRIVRKDVESLSGGASTSKQPASSPRPAPAPMPVGELESRAITLSNMRRTIASRLAESKSALPHYYVTVEILMDELIDLRKRLNEQLASQSVKLSVNDFIIRAVALAMHEHPFINSRWQERGKEVDIELIADVNIGVAIALDREEGGLVVGTVRNADQLGLRQISAEARRLATKAREKGLTIEEMSDATFTLSNLGMYGVDHYTAIINPPNAAILAVGGAMEKPIVKDGAVVPGHVMSCTLSSDHRIIDGAMAARYLQTLKGLLEAPATLLV
jgi:pyruvate dehydrogenase E2 component (dihydrolipoamide acetyltransferase)